VIRFILADRFSPKTASFPVAVLELVIPIAAPEDATATPAETRDTNFLRLKSFVFIFSFK
jgi:hypothetical protein